MVPIALAKVRFLIYKIKCLLYKGYRHLKSNLKYSGGITYEPLFLQQLLQSMYPNLYFAVYDIFGVHPPKFFMYLNSFGIMLALSFITAAYILRKELKRKSAAGWFLPEDAKVMVGKPASVVDLLVQFLVGFLFGYKFVGLFFSKPDNVEAQDYIFSKDGNLLAGLILGALMCFLTWYDANKNKLDKPTEKPIRIWPQDRVGELTGLAIVFGLLGAKLFHNFENWDSFVENPMAALLSFDGLTFYGGLILAAIAIIYYLRKKKIGMPPFLDAIGPALILAYAVGRIGCQVSGDGDWGIINTAYKVDRTTNKVVPATPADYDSAKVKQSYELLNMHDLSANIQTANGEELKKRVNSINTKSVKAPGFLPTWLFAYQYTNNVNGVGVSMQGRDSLFKKANVPLNNESKYYRQLPFPVFPTPFYETLMGFIIFFILWGSRHKVKFAGGIFAIYLFLNGLERFLIERIRVNTTYNISDGFNPTQAQIISFCLMLGGIGLWFYFKKLNYQKPSKA
jgi:phosphatidylglycerol---prolipoprotein diacylglyceryl transferase